MVMSVLVFYKYSLTLTLMSGMHIADNRSVGTTVDNVVEQTAPRCEMNLTWVDASLLTVLFSLGSLIVQGLTRREAQEVVERQQAACIRHEWVRIGSHGLICQLCGKIPG
jgi:hypothetical protein